MKSEAKTLHLWWLAAALLVVLGLLVACEGSISTATLRNTQASEPAQQLSGTATPVGSVTDSPAPTATPAPTGTRTPKPTMDPTSTAPEPVTPIATAASIHFAGWSPNSRWAVYWASSEEGVPSLPPRGFPTGVLHFANAETGESCAVPQFVAQDEPIDVRWSAERTAIILTQEGAFTGQPCQAEPFAPLSAYAADANRQPDPALSPDGSYRAATNLAANEDGILTFETTLTAHDGGQPLQAVTWRIDERLGDYDLMGEWIDPDKFLIYETLTEGPLILDVNEGVIRVLGALFGLSEAPSLLDEQGYGLQAIAAPGTTPDAYHLLLTGVGAEGNFPPVQLYHAENGLVETLPYHHSWWMPFSPEQDWLLMDERPDIGGYESHAMWTRPVEEIDGAWQSVATRADAVLWSDDGTEMAFSDDSRVTWQTFPDATPIGQWDSGAFWTRPVAWSPDGRYLAAEGSVPGEQRSGLFILRAD